MIRAASMLLSLCLVALVAPCAIAQKGGGQKPKPKPPVKKPETKLGAIGTAQLPGEWCEFGKAYTLGKDPKLNINLTSVEYVATHFIIDKEFINPDEESKLLVVKYTIHNPNPIEVSVQEKTIRLTAVDSKGMNRDHLSTVLAATGERLAQTLKPAQKVEVASVIVVSAEGQVPKLMVAASDQEQPVARYDLKTKIKALSPPYADPKDPTGASLSNELKVKIGQAAEAFGTEITLEKTEFVSAAKGLDVEEWEENQVGLMVTLSVKSYADSAISIQNGTFDMLLKDVDGGTTQLSTTAIAATTNRQLDLWLKPSESLRFRVLFVVPKGVELTALSFYTGTQRAILVDLGSIKG